MQSIFGCSNIFEKGKLIQEQPFFVTIKNFSATFILKLFRLKIENHEYKKTFILEIEYKESENEHRKHLFLGGFNSQLCFDYAEEANKLAEEFCKKENLNMYDHLNSWPTFWMIVEKYAGKQ